MKIKQGYEIHKADVVFCKQVLSLDSISNIWRKLQNLVLDFFHFLNVQYSKLLEVVRMDCDLRKIHTYIIVCRRFQLSSRPWKRDLYP